MSLVSFLAGDNTRHGNRELVIHLNCRSLLPKVDELRAVFDLSKRLFIAATETWLNNNIPDTRLTSMTIVWNEMTGILVEVA